MKQKMSVSYLACIAMFTALSYVAVLIAKVIPNVQGFLSYEPKDAIIVVAGFIFGPVSSAILSLLVSLIEMLTISSTGPWGFLMNTLASCAFTVPAAWIYSKKRTQKGAFLACFGDINISVHFKKKAKAGFFGGEGFLMQLQPDELEAALALT